MIWARGGFETVYLPCRMLWARGGFQTVGKIWNLTWFSLFCFVFLKLHGFSTGCFWNKIIQISGRFSLDTSKSRLFPDKSRDFRKSLDFRKSQLFRDFASRKKCFFLVRTLPSALPSIWKNLFFHLWTIKKKIFLAKKNSENLKSYTNISKKDGCEIWTRRHYHVPIKIRDFLEKICFFSSYASECPPEYLEKFIFPSLDY